MCAQTNKRKSAHDENIVIERCKKGDLSAFDELVRRYEKPVYNFAYRMAGNYDDASDIASEALIKVFNAIGSFRGEASFTTWLYRIVTNVYLDHRKRRRGRGDVSLDEYLELDEGSVPRQVVDTAPTPSEEFEIRARNDVLMRAVGELPEYQRMMVLLFHGQGLSYEEIAEIMSLPIGTVKSRLNRARLALREILKPTLELFD
ncbi:MAG TPA: RNA polymerase subunit sigma-24 [Armatimonadetes bacterium]|nr:RNA polymerase subunit sigma-24 [Armatimonadota bacterium]